MTERAKRILIVDDEPDIRRFLRASLKLYQYEILEAATGKEAIQMVDDHRPDLIILDLGLPDLDGVEVTRQVRQTSHIPIIILSVRNSENEKIEALDAGAEDYLTKPFGMGELLARVRVVLRRSEPQGYKGLLAFRDLRLDLARHKVTLKETEVTLTPTEFDILTVLMQNAGVVVTHHQLIQQVWGPAYEEDSGRLIRVNISNLRRKIEADPNRPTYILTELGVGYRFNDSEE
ncbi:MAG: response regulator transcription factor [Anaerolineaceae bacterium]|nr:response regulator transcription factor [Anaerolineaceae bacterium]